MNAGGPLGVAPLWNMSSEELSAGCAPRCSLWGGLSCNHSSYDSPSRGVPWSFSPLSR